MAVGISAQSAKPIASAGRWDWVPIPLVLALMAVLWVLDLRQVYVAPVLTLVLQLIFITAASAVVAYLMSRSFLAGGSWGALLLLCGMMLWGFASPAARLAGPGNFNGSVTIHNVSVFLAASCHLIGVLLAPGAVAGERNRHWWLLAAFAAAAAAVGFVAVAVFAEWMPQFFVQGQGGTLVRQVVLGSATAMLALSATLLWARSAAEGSAFARAYALGLGLAAAGLLGVLLSTVHSGPLNWAGVLTQCLSGAYFVAAGVAAHREAGVAGIPLVRVAVEARFRYALAVMFVAAALALRLLLDEALGARTLYVTFFPAVILATLYGGRGPGLVSIALSALAIDIFFMEPVGSVHVVDRRELGVLAIFAVSALLVVWIADVMQRSQARAAAAEADLRVAKAAERAKDEFLALLSHELRNPLAALSSAAHVLKIAPPEHKASAEARGIVERQTEHMSRLVGDLLDMSRVTFGKLALEREPFDLSEAVSRVVEVWRASGRLERHKVSVAAAPAWVDADRARVEQIVANLLDNALKFTPAGGPVQVDVEVEGGSALLRVSDQGRGFDPGDRERVFELFVQSGGPRESGLGIGLALVKRLAELQGGAVSATSAGRGRGATFVVRLPLAQRQVVRAAAPPARADGPRSLLILENNEDTRSMLEAALALDGHEIRATGDAITGLALAAEHPPDAALIDLAIGGMGGYEVARRLRASGGARLRLISLSSDGREEERRLAHAAGFDAHLTKPLTVERIDEALADLK